MGLAHRDLGYYTYADYCSWPDDVTVVQPDIVIDWGSVVRELDD